MSPALAGEFITEPSAKAPTGSWILTEVSLLARGIAQGKQGPRGPLDWSHILVTDVQSCCHKEVASTGTGHLPMATWHHATAAQDLPAVTRLHPHQGSD